MSEAKDECLKLGLVCVLGAQSTGNGSIGLSGATVSLSCETGKVDRDCLERLVAFVLLVLPPHVLWRERIKAVAAVSACRCRLAAFRTVRILGI